MIARSRTGRTFRSWQRFTPAPHSVSVPFMRMVDHIRDGFLPEFTAVLVLGDDAEFPNARDFAYTVDRDPPVVAVAPRMAQQPGHRVIALLAHELAHAVFFFHGDPDHTERQADELAEELFNLRIGYDAQDVQSTQARRPRPRHLPNPRR